MPLLVLRPIKMGLQKRICLQDESTQARLASILLEQPPSPPYATMVGRCNSLRQFAHGYVDHRQWCLTRIGAQTLAQPMVPGVSSHLGYKNYVTDAGYMAGLVSGLHIPISTAHAE
jgi:hypothetical protein